jgi:sugar fermentation stimulation protein A
MQFPVPIQRALLIKRYKRFLADVTLADGREVTAHCPNPGAMTGLAEPGMTIGLLPADNPKAKLRYSWELCHADGNWVGVNTNRPNRLAEEAILADRIPELTDYPTLRREVKYGTNSRVDLLLQGPDRPDCYVEVKNVHLMRTQGLAEFPDSVTARGAKHLEELAIIAKSGMRAVMLFIVQRTDCATLSLAKDIDTNYSDKMAYAIQSGVEILSYTCSVTEQDISVTDSIILAL